MSPDWERPVSVIVLTWNGLDVTRRCISTLVEKTTHPRFEVVAVDNGSTDGTLDYLRGVPGITVLENGENLGFVRGNNVGIRATDRDVVLLNNDTEIIQGDWLERMQELAYSSDDVGIVGCRLINAERELVHAGTFMPVPSFWGQEYPGKEKDIGQLTGNREVEGVIAACVYIKRELIEKIGPLDEDYFSYFEDTDYCLKARGKGYGVYCCGAATVLHLENASTDVNRMDFSGTFRRSREIFMSKWKDYYDNFFTRKITWHSFISGDDIYSRISAKILWALDRAGVDVNLQFLEGADKAELDDFRINDMKNRGTDRNRPQVLFGPAEMLSRADGDYNIGYVYTPYDRFPDDWVGSMNRMDEIWVTCDFQKEAARASGVGREIFVVPLGVDEDYFNPGIRAHTLNDRFTFLAPVEWGDAYASETLLRAYTDEFGEGENVVLVMMVDTPSIGAEVEHSVEAMNLPMERAPVVFVVDHSIPGYQTGSLYRSADCLVLAARCSEYGPRAMESIACGVPVIATGWGCASPLLDGKSAFSIEYGMVPSPRPGLNWAEPDYASLRSLMRRVRNEGDAAGVVAAGAAGEKEGVVGWDAVARRIVERLDEVSPGK